MFKNINDAWGYLQTDNGGSFELHGDYFTRSMPVNGGPSFPVGQLSQHLEGLRVISIGADDIGDEAEVLINGEGYDSAEKVEDYFSLHPNATSTVGELWLKLFNQDAKVHVRSNEIRAMELITGCGQDCKKLIEGAHQLIKDNHIDHPDAVKQILQAVAIHLEILYFG